MTRRTCASDRAISRLNFKNTSAHSFVAWRGNSKIKVKLLQRLKVRCFDGIINCFLIDDKFSCYASHFASEDVNILLRPFPDFTLLNQAEIFSSNSSWKCQQLNEQTLWTRAELSAPRVRVFVFLSKHPKTSLSAYGPSHNIYKFSDAAWECVKISFIKKKCRRRFVIINKLINKFF